MLRHGRNRPVVVVADRTASREHGPMPAPRRIVLLAFDGAQTLDFTGPLEVFAAADRIAGEPLLDRDRQPRRRPVRHQQRPEGRARPLDRGLPRAARHPGRGRRARCARRGAGRGAPALADRHGARGRGGWPRSAPGPSCSPAPACSTGAAATTHWASADQLAERYPSVRVDPDRIFVRDGADLDLGRRDRGHGPRAGAGGGRSRPRGRPGGGALAGRVRPAAGRPVAVQRSARGPDRRAAPRCARCRSGCWPTRPETARWRRWPCAPP